MYLRVALAPGGFGTAGTMIQDAEGFDSPTNHCPMV